MSTKHPPRARLLLVDDDRNLLESMGDWLRGRGFVVDEAATVSIACRLLERERFDAAVVDLRLNDGDGFDVLAVARRVQPECSVLLMTGYGTVETGIEALRAGAFDLLTKPLIDQELELALDRALRQKKVLEENHSLRAQLDERFGLENIVGHDVRMTRLFEVMQSVADTRATILITGESGTGKSLVARAIHRLSNRRDRPFVEVACGALPETLLESELFGHVQGSFTGATGNKVGKFAQADGGTLFLDEIGTASAALQVKLLRVLQEFQFEPVGGTQTISVDTRVVLATNENLEQAVADGRFRQDLFYRINVINLELPPLRERISDIPSLAEHMKIHEYQAKELFRKAGVAVLRGKVAQAPDEAAAAFQELGGDAGGGQGPDPCRRPRQGDDRRQPGQRGVQLVKSADEARTVAKNILGHKLVTIQTGPEGKTVNQRLRRRRAARSPASCIWASSSTARAKPVLMVSSEGGVEIEKVAEETPEKIFKEHFDPHVGLKATRSASSAANSGI
jgi:DNA-binding NtrC family response regulator